MGDNAPWRSASPAILEAFVWGFIGLLEPVAPRLGAVMWGILRSGRAACSRHCLGSPGLGCSALWGPAAIPGRPPLAHLLQIHRRQLHLLHVNLHTQELRLEITATIQCSWRW